ncbi:hypothetical protein ABZY33_34715, partial [Streptomyces sp. NPDC006552]
MRNGSGIPWAGAKGFPATAQHPSAEARRLCPLSWAQHLRKVIAAVLVPFSVAVVVGLVVLWP